MLMPPVINHLHRFFHSFFVDTKDSALDIIMYRLNGWDNVIRASGPKATEIEVS